MSGLACPVCGADDRQDNAQPFTHCDCGASWADQPLDPPGYAYRVLQLESQGLTRSDAQAVADAEHINAEHIP